MDLAATACQQHCTKVGRQPTALQGFSWSGLMRTRPAYCCGVDAEDGLVDGGAGQGVAAVDVCGPHPAEQASWQGGGGDQALLG